MSDCGDEHWQWLYPMAQLTISMAQLTDSMGICYFAVCMYCPDWGLVLLNRQTCDETSEKPRGGDSVQLTGGCNCVSLQLTKNPLVIVEERHSCLYRLLDSERESGHWHRHFRCQILVQLTPPLLTSKKHWISKHSLNGVQQTKLKQQSRQM